MGDVRRGKTTETMGWSDTLDPSRDFSKFVCYWKIRMSIFEGRLWNSPSYLDLGTCKPRYLLLQTPEWTATALLVQKGAEKSYWIGTSTDWIGYRRMSEIGRKFRAKSSFVDGLSIPELTDACILWMLRLDRYLLLTPSSVGLTLSESLKITIPWDW